MTLVARTVNDTPPEFVTRLRDTMKVSEMLSELAGNHVRHVQATVRGRMLQPESTLKDCGLVDGDKVFIGYDGKRGGEEALRAAGGPL